MQVHVVDNVLKLNDEIAQMNRQKIKESGVLAINIIGAPGCGKTALIESTIQLLGDRTRVGVIVGDLTTQRDADRMVRFTSHVVQVNTGKGCHLEANHVRTALANLDLSRLDILFIENVGNLICPVGFDLGQTVKIGVFGVCGGDDKAAKHPYIVHEAGLLILNKIDLLPHITFNLPQFRQDILRLNAKAELLELSSTRGTGMEKWIEWLKARRMELSRSKR